MPVACYRRKRSQHTLETETLNTYTFTSATAYEMYASYEMNELKAQTHGAASVKNAAQ